MSPVVSASIDRKKAEKRETVDYAIEDKNKELAGEDERETDRERESDRDRERAERDRDREREREREERAERERAEAPDDNRRRTCFSEFTMSGGHAKREGSRDYITCFWMERRQPKPASDPGMQRDNDYYERLNRGEPRTEPPPPERGDSRYEWLNEQN